MTASMQKRLISEVVLDHGMDYFDAHESGIRLPKEGGRALLAATAELRSFPSWTVLLEGHCPGRPEENNAIRESVGEEAADMCKVHLQQAGVQNRIICNGLGSVQGLGMRVRLSLVQPIAPGQDAPGATTGAATTTEEETLAVRGRKTGEVVVAAITRSAEEQAAIAKRAQGEAAVAAAARKAEEEAIAAAIRKAEEEATKAAAARKAEKEAATARKAKEEAAAVATRKSEAAAAATAKKAEEAAAAAIRRAEEEAAVAAAAKKKSEEAAAATAARKAEEEATAAATRKSKEEAAAAAAAREAEKEAASGRRAEEDAAAAATRRAGEEAVAAAAARRAEEEAAAAAAARKTEEAAAAVAARKAEREAAAAAAATEAEKEAAAVRRAEEDAAAAAARKAEEAAAAAATARREEKEAAAAAAARRAAEEAAAASTRGATEDGAAAAATREAEKEAAAARKADEKAAAAATAKAEEGAAAAAAAGKAGGEAAATAAASRAEEGAAATAAANRAEEGAAAAVAREAEEGEAAAAAAKRAQESATVAKSAEEAAAAAAGREAAAAGAAAGTAERAVATAAARSSEGAGRRASAPASPDVAVAATAAAKPGEAMPPSATARRQSVPRDVRFSLHDVEVVGTERDQPSVPFRAESAQLVRAESTQQGTMEWISSVERKSQLGSVEAAISASPQPEHGGGRAPVAHRAETANFSRLGSCLSMASTYSIPGLDLQVPDTAGMSLKEQEELLEELLDKVAAEPIRFKANSSEVDMTSPPVKRLASLLLAFPGISIWCVGHAKGRPSEDNEAKRGLSRARAEAVRRALEEELQIPVEIFCSGFGSALGRGLSVRCHVLSPEEAQVARARGGAVLKIPHVERLTVEEQEASLNQMLKDTLQSGLTFEPNRATIQADSLPAVERLAALLRAFPRWAVRCEGHAKGLPADDSEAKRQLSQARAEALKVMLGEHGVTNPIACEGRGSAQGAGMSVRMFAVGLEKELEIPDCAGLSEEERKARLQDLLDQVLKANVEFEPNKAEVPQSAAGTVQKLVRVLKAFPDFALRCEGHAKGRPNENTDAKAKLSLARAEAVYAAVKAAGTTNAILCKGLGCLEGRGMSVRMQVINPQEMKEDDVDIPDCKGMSPEEQRAVLNQLLEATCERPIEFEPNVYTVPLSAMGTIRKVVSVLVAFPTFAIRCEGHAKGKPADNNDAKKNLSLLRAEAVRAAVVAQGATNGIICTGEGSAQGLGARMRMLAVDSSELDRGWEREMGTEDTAAMPKEQQVLLLNSILDQILKENRIHFQPNTADLQVSSLGAITRIAKALWKFPDLAIQCEGHAKGKPEENNAAKVGVSQARSEAVRAALLKHGVVNGIECVGHGSAEGLGMCVKMCALQPQP